MTMSKRKKLSKEHLHQIPQMFCQTSLILEQDNFPRDGYLSTGCWKLKRDQHSNFIFFHSNQVPCQKNLSGNQYQFTFCLVIAHLKSDYAFFFLFDSHPHIQHESSYIDVRLLLKYGSSMEKQKSFHFSKSIYFLWWPCRKLGRNMRRI